MLTGSLDWERGPPAQSWEVECALPRSRPCVSFGGGSGRGSGGGGSRGGGSGGGGGGGIGASCEPSGVGDWVVSRFGEVGGEPFSGDNGAANDSGRAVVHLSILDNTTLAFFVVNFGAESLLEGEGGLESSTAVGGGEVGESSRALFPEGSLFVVSVVFVVCFVCCDVCCDASASEALTCSAGCAWSRFSTSLRGNSVSLLFVSVCVLCSVRRVSFVVCNSWLSMGSLIVMSV